MMEMVVENLPAVFGDPNFIALDSLDSPPGPPARPAPDAPSPYPDVELSILDRHRQPLASLYIVEHKEQLTSLTLHLPAPLSPTETYTARAEMTQADLVLQVVEVPFNVNPVE